MKKTPLLLALLLVAACVSPASGGQSVVNQQSFLESSRRQDFTGQGTYHRQGLLREQRDATRSAGAASPSSDQPGRTLWESFTRLFARKSQP